jgi:Uma2 family endonuclease
LGETGFHVTVILYLCGALRYFFRKARKVYVAANMLFYYEEGDPTAVKAPDVFVVKGVAKHDRRTYKLWKEKVAPCTIFEITSRKTSVEDKGNKRALYEMLGVREYFLFDPLGEYLKPRLQGLRLVKGLYQPMTLAADGTLRSEELGCILRPDGSLLRVVDPESGQPVPTMEEAAEAAAEARREARIAKRQAQAAAQQAQAAEAEVARLRAELEKLRRRR